MEFELLQLYAELRAQFYAAVTWWISITFGLYSIAYLAGKKLSTWAVAFVVMTYLFLTAFFIEQVVGWGRGIGAIRGDLRQLQQSGAEITLYSQSVINVEPIPWIGIASFLSAPAIALGGIVYLIMRFRSGRKIT